MFGNDIFRIQLLIYSVTFTSTTKLLDVFGAKLADTIKKSINEYNYCFIFPRRNPFIVRYLITCSKLCPGRDYAESIKICRSATHTFGIIFLQ